MASEFVNRRRREINLKIVYYGPPLSGKTTNLELLFEQTPAKNRSDLMSVKTAEDRTLFFDFLQVEMGKIMGLTPKFKLYTVPGQAYYKSSRRLVLQGVDGVVFVADSDPQRMVANAQSWRSLAQHLHSYRIDIRKFPLVIQANKQDVPNAVPPAKLAQMLRATAYPTTSAVAINGVGVTTTLKKIVQAVLLQNNFLNKGHKKRKKKVS